MKSSPKTSPAFRLLKIATHRELLSVPARFLLGSCRSCSVPARSLGGARSGPAAVPPWAGCASRPRFARPARASAGARGPRAQNCAKCAHRSMAPVRKTRRFSKNNPMVSKNKYRGPPLFCLGKCWYPALGWFRLGSGSVPVRFLLGRLAGSPAGKARRGLRYLTLRGRQGGPAGQRINQSGLIRTPECLETEGEGERSN